MKNLDDQVTQTSTKLIRLKRETHWIKTLVTLEPFGLNERTYEPKFRTKNELGTPYVVPYSKTGTLSANIINKHYKELQSKNSFDFNSKITTAYSKHKNLGDLLVTSKLHN